MTNKKQTHVTYRKKLDNWAVTKSSNKRASQVFDTKKEAEKAGTVSAKKDKSELFVHNQDGKIAYKNSYGNDPYPPKG